LIKRSKFPLFIKKWRGFISFLLGLSFNVILLGTVACGEVDPVALLERAKAACDKDPNIILKENCAAEEFGGSLVSEGGILAEKEEILSCKKQSGLQGKALANCIPELHYRNSFSPASTEACEQMGRCSDDVVQELTARLNHFCSETFSESYLQIDCNRGLYWSIKKQVISAFAKSMNLKETSDLTFLVLFRYLSPDWWILLFFLFCWLVVKIIDICYWIASERIWERKAEDSLKGQLKKLADVYFATDVPRIKRIFYNHRDIFQINLIAVLACFIKTDRRVEISEIDAATRGFINSNFDEENISRFTGALLFALTQDFDLREICESFRDISQYAERLMLIRIIREIAVADGPLTDAEKDTISWIAEVLGINIGDRETTQAEFARSEDKYYRILGVGPGATEMEVKRAYRRLALNHHPDRVAHLGKEYVEIATKKMQIINEAYEKVLGEIRSRRRMFT
jgi:DnaJ like chaperone protein